MVSNSNIPKNNVEDNEAIKRKKSKNKADILAKNYIEHSLIINGEYQLLDILSSSKLSNSAGRDIKKYIEQNPKFKGLKLSELDYDSLLFEARRGLKESKIKKNLNKKITENYSDLFSSNKTEKTKQEDKIKAMLEGSSYQKLIDYATNEVELLKFLDSYLGTSEKQKIIIKTINNIDPVLESIVVEEDDVSDLYGFIKAKDSSKVVNYLDEKGVSDSVKKKALVELGVDITYKNAINFGILTTTELEKKLLKELKPVKSEQIRYLMSDDEFLSGEITSLNLNKLTNDQLNKVLADKLIEKYHIIKDFKDFVDNSESPDDYDLDGLAKKISEQTNKRLDALDFEEGNYVVFNGNSNNNSERDLKGVIKIRSIKSGLYGKNGETLPESGSESGKLSFEIEYVSDGSTIIPSESRKKDIYTIDQFERLLIKSAKYGDFDIIHDKIGGNLTKNINGLGYDKPQEILYDEDTIGKINKTLDFLDPDGKDLEIKKSSLPIVIEGKNQKGILGSAQIIDYSDSKKTVTIESHNGEIEVSYEDFVHGFKEQKLVRKELIKSKDEFIEKLQSIPDLGEKWGDWKTKDIGNSKVGIGKEINQGDKTVTKSLKYIRGKNDTAVEILSIDGNNVVFKTGKLKNTTREVKEDKGIKYEGDFGNSKFTYTYDQFLSAVKNNELEPIDELGDSIKIEENQKGGSDVGNDFFKSLTGGFFNALSLEDIISGGKKIVEHIEGNLKDAAYFRAEKVAYQYAKAMGLGDDFRIKLESRMTSKIEEIKDTLKSVDAGTRKKKIEKMMRNSSTTTEEKIASVLAVLEKYGTLEAKGFGDYPVGTWYKFMGGTPGDENWKKEVERSQEEKVPFNEVAVIMGLVQQWGRDGITGTNVYKKIKGSRPSGFQDEFSTGQNDAKSMKSASAKKRNFLDEFDGNTYPNAIGNVEEILKSGAVYSHTDMGFYSNIMLLTGVSDRYDELALLELQKIAYGGAVPSYIFLMKTNYMKLYREVLNSVLGEKYGDVFKKLISGSTSLKDKVRIFDSFWSEHGEEVTKIMNCTGDYTILKNKDKEPYKEYLNIIGAETGDMGADSTYPTALKEGGWAATYDYDLFTKIDFETSGSFRGKGEYIFKGLVKTAESIANNSDLTNEEKASMIAPIMLKFSRVMIDKHNPDSPAIAKSFYGSVSKWGKLESLGAFKISNTDAVPETVETTHYDKMYNSILNKLNSGIKVGNDFEDEEGKIDYTGDTQKYVNELIGGTNGEDFQGEINPYGQAGNNNNSEK